MLGSFSFLWRFSSQNGIISNASFSVTGGTYRVERGCQPVSVENVASLFSLAYAGRWYFLQRAGSLVLLITEKLVPRMG